MSVRTVAWQALQQSAGPARYAAALRIVQRGGVLVATVEEDSEWVRLEALVDDGRRSEGVAVALRVDDPALSDADCGCGRAPACDHTAALLLEVAGLAEPAVSAEQPVRAWRRELDRLLPADRHDDVALCLFVEVREPTTAEYRWGGGPKHPFLGLRPGMMGARNRWIKGSISWDRLDAVHADPAAVAMLREIARLDSSLGDPYRAWSRPEWLDAGRLASRSLWPLLTSLAGAGIALVGSPRQTSVELADEPVNPTTLIVAHGSSLRVSARVTLGGETLDPARMLLLGEPAVALATTSGGGPGGPGIRLHPLASPLSPGLQTLLRRKAALTVDSSDRDDFERSYLPRLRALAPVVSPDGSYSVPVAADATLVMTADDDGTVLQIRWRWERPAGPADRPREHEVLGRVAEATRAAATPLARLEGADRPADLDLAGADRVLFVAEVLPLLEGVEGVRVEIVGTPPAFRRADSAPEVSVATSEGTDWFDLHVTVDVDGERVEFADLFAALARGDELFALPSGTFFRLDDPGFDRLRRVIEEARDLNDRPVEALRIGRYQLDLWEEFADLGTVAREAQWWLALRALGTSAGIAPVAPPASLHATLRDYQRDGLAWLDFLRRHDLGGVLADDMGLGKTLQTIAMIETARAAGELTAPFLIVAPTSVVGNWATECARFAPELRVARVDATTARRAEPLAEIAAGADVVITSYALHRLESDDYAAERWAGVVFDEAQQIKNASSSGYRAARALDTPFTLVITGTPLENDLYELWALVSLACPGLLGGRSHFGDHFRTPVQRHGDGEKLATLRRRLAPFLLRRTKDLVAPELPEKQEQTLELELHPAHRRLYDRRLQRERQRVLGLLGDLDGNRFEIFRSLMLLRQLALDPALVDEGDAAPVKLDALDDLLQRAVGEGHRVLVLSQFTRFLRRARERADAGGIATSYLDGTTADRAAVIDRFRSGEARAFFVSLKAGGVGLNLPEADYVVLLDPWWNPAVEAQAVDRAHRIGRTRPVIVYRFVSRGTVEQKVVALKERKAALFHRVLDDGAPFTAQGLTADDIRSLIDD